MSVSHNGRGDSLKRESLLACRLRIMPSMHCSILASMFSFFSPAVHEVDRSPLSSVVKSSPETWKVVDMCFRSSVAE